MRQPITRRRHGGSFHYFRDGVRIEDPAELARIKDLAIPPAWRDVEIARTPRAQVQATGRDAAGRKQAIYSQAYRRAQDKTKFRRIIEFANRLPAMRRQVDKDLARSGLGKDKVIALIVKLMDEAYFRVGNQVYAEQNQSYGLTTLRSKHVEINGDEVSFEFIGKSGQKQSQTITDRQVARLVRRLDELPGYEIFRYIDEAGERRSIDSQDVNEYIKHHMGDDYTAKDFRTWGGTLLMATELVQTDWPDNKTLRKKTVTACLKKVAEQLGNTPAVTRSSYVDPRLINRYLESNVLAETAKALFSMKPRRYMHPEERCLLEVLV